MWALLSVNEAIWLSSVKSEFLAVAVSFLFYFFLHIFLHFCAQLSCLYNVCGHEAPMAVSSHPHQARLARAWSQIFWAVKNSLVEPRPSQPHSHQPLDGPAPGHRVSLFWKTVDGMFQFPGNFQLGSTWRRQTDIFSWYSGQTTNYKTCQHLLTVVF